MKCFVRKWSQPKLTGEREFREYLIKGVAEIKLLVDISLEKNNHPGWSI